ncbi:uncharacterized protein LOC123208561 [Mangifera indica]|uniref:uncharacterized protein LOC123208561 n=1 Tax=Mangifera indica TaxID=29780 RepID=UPI001CFB8849|nr:uncharacterized protein LOC123208561 [Mangifera indica]
MDRDPAHASSPPPLKTIDIHDIHLEYNIVPVDHIKLISESFSVDAPLTSNLSTLVPLRRSSKTIRPSIWTTNYICLVASVKPYPISNYISYDRLAPTHRACINHIFEYREPTSYSKAVQSHHWRQAMVDEFQALSLNKTWNLVSRPLYRKPIKCKCIFKIKYHADGSIEHYKARLIAKGFTQQEGLDNQETFSPGAKHVTVCTFITVVASHDWPLC